MDNNKKWISDYQLFKMIKERIDRNEEKAIFDEKHLALSDEDKFVEDFLILGLYVVKQMNLTNIVRFECSFDNPDVQPLSAIDNKGNKTILDFYEYVGFNTPVQEAYLDEAEAIEGDGNVDPNRICEKINKISERFLKDNIKHN